MRATYLSKPSEHSLYTIVQVLRVLIIVLAGILGYFMFISDTEINFRIEWNMFNSILKYPLLVIGFLLSLGTKFDFIPVLVTKNEWGNVTNEERDYDLGSSMDGCFMQIIGYLVLGPIMGAAMIYYPLMGIVYLFGKIFPLLILVFFIFTLFLFYKWQNVCLVKNSSSGSLATITLFGSGILWLLTYTWMPKEDPALQIIHIATGVFIAAAILLFIFSGKKKPAPGMSMETPLEELIAAAKKVQVPVISSKFIIAYIVCLLIVVCIYTFKVVS